MKYVIGVDLGTSAVKVLLVNSEGEVTAEASEAYPLHQPRSGYSEQDPEDWVRGTLAALSRVVKESGVDPQAIEGISFSGQMHGLVLLDENHVRCAMPFCGTIRGRRKNAARSSKYLGKICCASRRIRRWKASRCRRSCG